MTTPATPLQRAVYGALTGDATLMAAVTGVFDFVPDGQAFPFIRIGDAEMDDRSAEDVDGFVIDLTIHSWHRPGARGRAPAHTIMDHIHRILHRSNLAVTGFKTVSLRAANSRILVDPDAVTLHGVQQFRVLLAKIEE